MPLRAFLARAAVVALMVALTVTLTVAVAPLAVDAGSAAAAGDPTPPVTVNPFIPEDRSISECVSALPKPGCGSEERGGWHQYLVFIALVGGLSIIGWRIVAGMRRGRQVPTRAEPSTEREPAAGATTD